MKRESWKKLWPFMKAEQEATSDLRLVGELTVLRSKSMDDAEADYSWRIDPELADLDATRPVTLSYPEYLRYHRDDVNYPSPWSVRMAIETLDGRHIGNCMYYDINTEKSQCELGIMIGDRKYWSKGYGTDVIRTALARIFSATELDRVYLHTLTHNFRAQKSFAKAGFLHVREVKRDGNEFKLMEIWRQEWEAAQPNKISPATANTSSSEVSAPATAKAQTQTQADTDPLLGS
jgi:RimJ/RimL family protein N-acetyltransferase